MPNLLFYVSAQDFYLVEHSQLRAQQAEVSWSHYLRDAIAEKLARDADQEAIVATAEEEPTDGSEHTD